MQNSKCKTQNRRERSRNFQFLILNFELKLPLLWLLTLAFSLQPSAFAQQPSVFQPVKRPSGSLNATNVFGFSQEFTNFGGTISLVHPPPPGAVGTNDFNTNQFSWTTSRKISIKSGALTTNLNVRGLLLGNTNIYTDDGTELLRNGLPLPQVWTLDSGDVYTTDPTATNVLVENLEVSGAARMDQRFGFGSTSTNLSLGTNDIFTLFTANKVLFSPTNDATRVVIRLSAPYDAQELYLKNGDSGTAWTLKDGQLNSDSGSVQLQGGDFVSGNGTNLVLHLLGEGGNWQEVGRFWPGSTNGIAVINRTDQFIPYRVDPNHFADSPLRVLSSTSIVLTNDDGAAASLFISGTNASGRLQLVSGPAGSQVTSGGGLNLVSATGASLNLFSGTDELTFIAKTFYGASNDITGGGWNVPFKDWFSKIYTLMGTDGSTNAYTDDGSSLLRNGVPIVSSPWTDDGTTTYLNAGNTNAFRITDATGDTSIGTNANSLLTFSASSNYQIVAMNWTDGTNAQATFMQLQDTNVAPVSSFEVDVGATPLVTLFPFVPDGAGSVAYTFDTANVLGTAGAFHTVFRHSGTNVATISPDGNISLSSATNLIGDNGSGITWNGLPVSPWTDDGMFIYPSDTTLSNTAPIVFRKSDGSLFIGSNSWVYGSMENSGAVFPLIMTSFTDSNQPSVFLADLAVANNVDYTAFADIQFTGDLSDANAPLLGLSLNTQNANGDARNLAFNVTTNNSQFRIAYSSSDGSFFRLWDNGDVTTSGTLSLQNQTNLIGMSAGGQLTVDGVPVGGGSQTPWTSDIDGAGFQMSSISNITFSLNDDLTGTSQRFIGFPVASGTTAFGGGLNILAGSANSTVDEGGGGELQIAAGDSLANGNGGSITMRGGNTFTNAPGNVTINPGQNDAGDAFGIIYLSTFPSLISLVNGRVQALPRLGGGQVSISDTNGIGNLINIYASTNSGSAVLYTEGSPPTATVPIDETSGAYVFPNTVTTNLVIPLVATIRITNGLVMAVTGP